VTFTSNVCLPIFAGLPDSRPPASSVTPRRKRAAGQGPYVWRQPSDRLQRHVEWRPDRDRRRERRRRRVTMVSSGNATTIVNRCCASGGMPFDAVIVR
jgi:hypothetical protein